MAPTPSERMYDLVVFGATGYTGKLTSEQLLLGAPSTLRWAIAGRSLHKLEVIAADYNARFPDRVPVGTFVSDLTEVSLEKLAGCTRCLISAVGPFIKYGTPVVAACAKNGTHYVDCTGEIPWVKAMIEKYHDIAHNNGAIMIPQCGVESAPADLSAYALVKFVRANLNCPVANIVFAVDDIKAAMSGGTLESINCIFEHCSIREVIESTKPYSMSPIKGSDLPYTFPIQRHKELGLLTTWVQAVPDMVLVMRSWGLHGGGEYYGKKFTFREYLKTSNWLTAVGWLALINIFSIFPLIAPFRWLARKFLTQPGEGPSAEQASKHRVEWHGVAEADDGNTNHRKAFISFRCEKDCYILTGILLAHTALGILLDEDSAARKMGGGILTPSTVATHRYFRDLERAGVHIEIKLLD